MCHLAVALLFRGMCNLQIYLIIIIFSSFEFANNEYVNDLACISLETASTESGSKDFIVVGTTIDRGEDLAARGAVSPLPLIVFIFALQIGFFIFPSPCLLSSQKMHSF